MSRFFNLTADIVSPEDSIDLIEHGQNGYVYDPLPASTGGPVTVAPSSSPKPPRAKETADKDEIELTTVQEIEE